MDKITYLVELAEGLARWVPERERQDILRWYAEYFEEAGPDREAEVVAELGDPWALSSRLAVEGGYVTYEKAASWTPRKRWPKVLLGTAVGLAVFTLIFGFGLLAINVTRTVSSGPVHVFGEAEQVTFVDWDNPSVWGEFEIGYAYFDKAPGVYFIDGENVAYVNSINAIDVDVGLGNIQVVAGDDFTLSVGWSEDMIGYEPTWEVRDGVFRLRAGSGPQTTKAFVWNDLKELFSAGLMTVDVIITVPENAALDKISVKTGLGDVLVWGVVAETVTAETGLGDVECYEARNVRQLSLNTGVGNICLVQEDAWPGLDMELESGTGNVEVSLGCRERDCAYVLESGIGTVTVNGDYQNTKVERRGNQPYQLSAASGMGDVNVYFMFD